MILNTSIILFYNVDNVDIVDNNKIGLIKHTKPNRPTAAFLYYNNNNNADNNNNNKRTKQHSINTTDSGILLQYDIQQYNNTIICLN